MLKVVLKPFKSAGIFYPTGSIIQDPNCIKRLRSKMQDRKIVDVDEHNVDDITRYLLDKYGVDVREELTSKLSKDKEYREKVYRLADKFSIQTEDKTLDEIVDLVKAEQNKAKAGQNKAAAKQKNAEG